MKLFGGVVAAAIAGVLVAGCGGEEAPPKSAADVVSLTVDGATTSYSDEAVNVSILAAGSAGNTVLTLSAAPLTFTISVPAGVTGGAVTATVTYVTGVRSCAGTVSANVTTHDTTHFTGRLAGSFPATSLTCTLGTTPAVIGGTFSAGYI